MPDDLNKLSKEQLIALVLQLTEQNEQLQDRLARLEKNSSNSSKPPSSDIIDPQPKSKTKRKRKVGGQRGHKNILVNRLAKMKSTKRLSTHCQTM